MIKTGQVSKVRTKRGTQKWIPYRSSFRLQNKKFEMETPKVKFESITCALNFLEM